MFKNVFEIWIALIEGHRIRAINWKPHEFIQLNLKRGHFIDDKMIVHQEGFNFTGQAWLLWEEPKTPSLTFEEAKDHILSGHDVKINVSYRGANGEPVNQKWQSSGGDEEFFDVVFCEMA